MFLFCTPVCVGKVVVVVFMKGAIVSSIFKEFLGDRFKAYSSDWLSSDVFINTKYFCKIKCQNVLGSGTSKK